MATSVEPAARPGAGITGALTVVPCSPMQPTLEFFTQRLGFRVDAIFPADSPSVAELSGHGLAIRLQPGEGELPGAGVQLRLRCLDPDSVAGGERELVAPNGTRVTLVHADPPLVLPPERPELVVTHVRDGASWGTGRAGMQYRDIIPGRLGGRFIGSHIRIPTAGPVGDYVHYHKVRFQMIYCHKGWVRVAYEDQGEPVLMEAGDCVLQPPQIRHRVLESGDGLEVVELGCPAEHETLADHTMPLPTGRLLPDKDFGGQRFVFHDASEADWHPWRFDGFEYRDIGIGRVTDGLAGVRVARPAGALETPRSSHDAEFVFGFVLSGTCRLDVDGRAPEEMVEGDTFVIPRGLAYALTDCTVDFQLLDVTLPEAVPTS